MSFKNIAKNIAKRGLKDITNPKRIKAYLQHKKIQKEGVRIEEKEILAFSEQIVYRSLQCGDCLALGVCRVCGCSQPELLSTPSARCDEGKWGPVMPSDQWETYKKQMNIKIVLQ